MLTRLLLIVAAIAFLLCIGAMIRYVCKRMCYAAASCIVKALDEWYDRRKNGRPAGPAAKAQESSSEIRQHQTTEELEMMVVLSQASSRL